MDKGKSVRAVSTKGHADLIGGHAFFFFFFLLSILCIECRL